VGRYVSFCKYVNEPSVSMRGGDLTSWDTLSFSRRNVVFRVRFTSNETRNHSTSFRKVVTKEIFRYEA